MPLRKGSRNLRLKGKARNPKISISALKRTLRMSHRKQSKKMNKWMTGGKVRKWKDRANSSNCRETEDLEGEPFSRAHARRGCRSPGHSRLHPKAAAGPGASKLWDRDPSPEVPKSVWGAHDRGPGRLPSEQQHERGLPNPKA